MNERDSQLVRLEVDVKAKLDEIGHKKESYNDIIKRILKRYKEVEQIA
ncbi:MAG: hypothetical protein O3C48_08310 [Crenarchaeota archaeon]|nr:hypothetical protein [Thermoproteota archaeon]